MLKNGLYNVLGAVIRIGLSILTIPLLIRLIGVEEYGLWTISSAVIAVVGLAEAGLSVSTTVFLSKDLANNDSNSISETLTVILGIMLILATSAAIALWITAPKLVLLFPKLNPRQNFVFVEALQIGGIIIWARLLQKIFVGVEQAYQKYGLINVINTVQISFINIGMLLVAWFGGKTKELMQWQALISIGILIIHSGFAWLLLKRIRVHLAWNTTKGFTIAKYSLITWFGSLGGALFSKADRIVLGAFLGTAPLGVYAAITNITGQIHSLSALAVQPLLPGISKQVANKQLDKPVLQQQVKQSLEINCLFALGIGAAFLMFAPQVMQIMISGESVGQYTSLFKIATIIYALYSLNAVGYYILFGLGLVNSSAAIVFISGIISLILIAIGSYIFGLLGAIVGNIGCLLTLLLTFRAIKKLTIPTKLCLDWLKFPIVWFLLSILISIITPKSLVYKIFIFTLQTILIGTWFKTVQNFSIKNFIHSFLNKSRS